MSACSNLSDASFAYSKQLVWARLCRVAEDQWRGKLKVAPPHARKLHHGDRPMVSPVFVSATLWDSLRAMPQFECIVGAVARSPNFALIGLAEAFDMVHTMSQKNGWSVVRPKALGSNRHRPQGISFDAVFKDPEFFFPQRVGA